LAYVTIIFSVNAAARMKMRHIIKELRRRGDLTQIELAKKSGVPRSRIQLAEAGTIELRIEELQAIKEVVIPELARTAALLATELEVIVESNKPHPRIQRNVQQTMATEESSNE
jgi:predicted transcriptional regulator